MHTFVDSLRRCISMRLSACAKKPADISSVTAAAALETAGSARSGGAAPMSTLLALPALLSLLARAVSLADMDMREWRSRIPASGWLSSSSSSPKALSSDDLPAAASAPGSSVAPETAAALPPTFDTKLLRSSFELMVRRVASLEIAIEARFAPWLLVLQTVPCGGRRTSSLRPQASSPDLASMALCTARPYSSTRMLTVASNEHLMASLAMFSSTRCMLARSV
mmetsp:Transcript_29610/g.85033  ORF Transcript_29610/g.85033 Transcript_29610/m.85033 type:complete len:224 (+) Transcript_29610:99-770(+)